MTNRSTLGGNTMSAFMSHEMFSRRGQHEATPKFRITVEERAMYTYACIYSSDPAFEPNPEHISRILEQCSQPGCERIIIDNRTGKSFAGIDFLQTATQFPGFGLAHTRVAMVDPDAPGDRGDGLVIVIGRSSSIKVRVFTSITDAEGWLTAH